MAILEEICKTSIVCCNIYKSRSTNYAHSGNYFINLNLLEKVTPLEGS
jgi:hypothetical protein